MVMMMLGHRLNNISELNDDLALAIGFALSFGLCYNVWANDLCNISELKNEEISIILLSKLRRTDWMARSHYAISQR